MYVYVYIVKLFTQPAAPPSSDRGRAGRARTTRSRRLHLTFTSTEPRGGSDGGAVAGGWASGDGTQSCWRKRFMSSGGGTRRASAFDIEVEVVAKGATRGELREIG